MAYRNIELHVIVTDDNIHDHTFIKHALSEFKKVNVISFYTGEDLLNHLKNACVHEKGDEPCPDLVLLDINMPCMSGIEVLQHLKESMDYDLNRIAIFSTCTDFDAHRCKEFGVRVYNKPDSFGAYGDVIQNILQQHVIKFSPDVAN